MTTDLPMWANSAVPDVSMTSPSLGVLYPAGRERESLDFNPFYDVMGGQRRRAVGCEVN
jgi:hypothetical protein